MASRSRVIEASVTFPFSHHQKQLGPYSGPGFRNCSADSGSCLPVRFIHAPSMWPQITAKTNSRTYLIPIYLSVLPPRVLSQRHILVGIDDGIWNRPQIIIEGKRSLCFRPESILTDTLHRPRPPHPQ